VLIESTGLRLTTQGSKIVIAAANKWQFLKEKIQHFKWLKTRFSGTTITTNLKFLNA